MALGKFVDLANRVGENVGVVLAPPGGPDDGRVCLVGEIEADQRTIPGNQEQRAQGRFMACITRDHLHH